MASTELIRLANIITENVQTVEKHLRVKNLQCPSFDVDAPLGIAMLKDFPHIDQARAAAIEASMELSDLLQGPLAMLRPNLNGTSLQAIYKYNVAAKVPIHGSISFEELASSCDIYEPDLRRILRYAITHHHVFVEPKKGFVAHTSASRLLAEDKGVYDGLGLMFDECWQSMAQTVNAMQKFNSQEPNQTGFSVAHGTHESMFEYLAQHPEKAKRFASAMKSFATVPQGKNASPSVSLHVLGKYRWDSIGKGMVVDVGGSEGHVSIALAMIYPDLQFVVQDRPEVIREAVNRLPETVADRVTFMAHDFFTDQPVTADVYLLRRILHNWPDAYAVKILKSLVPAFNKGARIIVNDDVLAEPNTLPRLVERQVRAMDMTMLSLYNSRERDRDDWVDLFHQADSRLRLVEVHVFPESDSGIIEFEWSG